MKHHALPSRLSISFSKSKTLPSAAVALASAWKQNQWNGNKAQNWREKKTEVSFWPLTEKDKLPINKFKSREGIGALKAGRQIIQNFPLTLAAKQLLLTHAQRTSKM